jgi:hypothetical protein
VGTQRKTSQFILAFEKSGVLHYFYSRRPKKRVLTRGSDLGLHQGHSQRRRGSFSRPRSPFESKSNYKTVQYHLQKRDRCKGLVPWKKNTAACSCQVSYPSSAHQTDSKYACGYPIECIVRFSTVPAVGCTRVSNFLAGPGLHRTIITTYTHVYRDP